MVPWLRHGVPVSLASSFAMSFVRWVAVLKRHGTFKECGLLRSVASDWNLTGLIPFSKLCVVALVESPKGVCCLQK